MSSDHDSPAASSGAGEGDEPGSISDDQLPEDLVPGEDNPLAEPAEEGESAIDPEIEPGGERERPYEKTPDDR